MKAAPRADPWTSQALVAVVLAVITLVIFLPALSFDFINFDDPEYFTSNPHVLNGLTWDGVKWAFGIGNFRMWLPLTWLSLMLDVELFGTGARGPHLVNVLLHATNAALLFVLLRRLTGATWRSAMVAALFAWHPLRVESVAWVTERKDVLSVFFGLLSMICYSTYAGRSKGRASKLAFGLALLFFALGLMSKPMLVTLPFLLLLLDFWPLRRFTARVPAPTPPRSVFSLVARHGSLLVEKVPFFALSLAGSAATLLLHREHGSLVAIPWSSRLANTFVSIATYLGKTIWPVKLAFFYPREDHRSSIAVIAAVLLFAGLSAVTLLVARRVPAALFGWWWFVGALLPVSGLVQAGEQGLADRFTYVPCIGLFVAIVWGSGDIAARFEVSSRGLALVAALLLIACVARTRDQLRHWQSSETLFAHALAVTERNLVAANLYGSILALRGETEKALVYFRQAVHDYPDNATARTSLGLTLVRAGHPEEAVAELRMALRGMREPWVGHNNLAIALGALGRTAESLHEYEIAERARPDYGEAFLNHGIALSFLERLPEAESKLRHAIRVNPGMPVAHKALGVVLTKQGRRAEAMAELTEALRLDPGLADAARRLRELQVQPAR